MPRRGEGGGACPDSGEEGAQNQELSRLQRQIRLLEGDRRAYADEVCNVILKQKSEIKALEQENCEIDTVLKLTESDKNADMDEANTIALQKHIDTMDALNQQAEEERRVIARLEMELKRVRKEIIQQRKVKAGISGQILEKRMLKKTKVMENRHDKAMVKFNKQLAVNTQLRLEIDHLRQEKVVFDNLYRKLSNELEGMRKEMSLIIEEASQAYEERDEAYTKMVALKERSEKDTNQHEMEMKEFLRILEHDRKLKEFMMLKSNDRMDYKEEEDAKKKKLMKGDRDVDSENNQIMSYEEAFSEIKGATGEDDIVLIMKDFLRKEDNNFALFNYVNEMNDEVEKLEDEINVMESEISRFEEEDVLMKAERKVWLKELEDRSTKAGKEADANEKRIKELSQVLDELRDGVMSLFRCLGCDRTSLNEMLGSEEGVTERNILQYMGIIEQRTTELLHMQHYIEMRTLDPEMEHLKDSKNKEIDLKKFRSPAVNPVTIAPPGIGEEEDFNEFNEENEVRPLTHDELKVMVMKRITKSTGNISSLTSSPVKDAKTRLPRAPRVEVTPNK